jgi:hypothetical protein
MIERGFTGLPPRITFTADFHELVRGDLQPGSTMSFRYDPARIVPPSEVYTFGDPAHRIFAHVMFLPHRNVVSVPLHSPSGALTHPDTDATGAGDMLSAVTDIPGDATAIVMWFTHQGPYNQTSYDSDFGHNFHFGFPSQQIGLVEATVRKGPSRRPGSFTVKVAAVPEVHRVVVRMRVVGVPTLTSSEHDLKRSGEHQSDGWFVWELDPVEVPPRAVVQFKLYFWTDNVRYKDDNSGLYYLAYQGAPERVPAPPAALAEAAKAWT